MSRKAMGAMGRTGETHADAPAHRHRQLLLFGITFCVIACGSVSASADVGFAVHAEGSAARMVGDRKGEQFGWGGGGFAAPELTLGTRVGIEIPIGALALVQGDLSEVGLADSDDGYSIFAMPGLRLRPFGRNGSDAVMQASGLWLAGGGGLAYTGELARAALNVRLGYDLFAGSTFRFGPVASFVQIVETENEVIPEDARILMFGLHAAFERPKDKVIEPEVDDDRDRDGYKNAIDGCPDEPEDFDTFEDADGCPDPDNDKDTILDKVDDCPLRAEDFDKFKDEDGCPDPDNDEDGILDKKDDCPLVPEDPDGFEDDDGCPDLDNDQDGIPDKKDDCPNDPETPNGYADEDGCPDEDNVRVVGDEIILDERVYFRVNMADIQFRSWSLIQNVAKLLIANPQFTLVRVQGHADDSGEDDYNLRLSIRRSESVRSMLMRNGVTKSRLKVEGFGERKPAQSGSTAGARRKNRRVEFLILKRAPLVGAIPTKPTPATKPDTTKPDTTKPDTTKPDTTKPDTKPDAKPDTTKPSEPAEDVYDD